uniref:Uncharacterized protein n=1 Tax=Anguilla anguilla TaxID=7936 RepID=A0A0E9S146_ANGAN
MHLQGCPISMQLYLAQTLCEIHRPVFAIISHKLLLLFFLPFPALILAFNLLND